MKMLKKLQYNKLYFIFVFTLVFSTLVFSRVESAAVIAPVETPQVGTQTLPPNSKIFAPQAPAQVAPEKPQLSQTKTVLPVKKTEGVKTHKRLFRFLKAMFGVLLSAVVIFGGLKLYKFFVSKKDSSPNDKKNINSLESPKTFKDTINLFLDKTDK